MPPLVSIIVNSFNYAPYVGTAIESVLGQGYERAGDRSRAREAFNGATNLWRNVDGPFQAAAEDARKRASK